MPAKRPSQRNKRAQAGPGIGPPPRGEPVTPFQRGLLELFRSTMRLNPSYMKVFGVLGGVLLTWWIDDLSNHESDWSTIRYVDVKSTIPFTEAEYTQAVNDIAEIILLHPSDEFLVKLDADKLMRMLGEHGEQRELDRRHAQNMLDQWSVA